MSLTEAQLKARDGKLTASRVACLMTGDETKIMNLWREMVGDPAFIADDLSGVWPVRLGEATEALNLSWYERKTGRALTRKGEVVVCPRAEWAASTLDGWDAAVPAVIECKHVGGYEARDVVLARYQPQLHWQMICTGAKQAVLSVIEGAKEPALEVVDFDESYAAELWTRAERFMACVRDLVEPVTLAPVAAPVKAEKIYDMRESNAWAAHAADWLAHKEAAGKFDKAAKEIKGLTPADAAKAHGHGIAVSRNKAGALSIKAKEA